MAKLPLTARLARLSARRPWIVIAVWVGFLILAGLAASQVGNVLGADEMDFINTPESARGAQLLEDGLRGVTPETETVVIRSETATVDDPAFRQVVESVAEDVGALDGVVTSAFSYYDAKAFGAPQAESMVSADRRATIIQVALVDEAVSGEDRVQQIQDALAHNSEAGYQILTIGSASVTKDFTDTAESDLIKAEIFGLPVTLLVLVVVFGAVAAAGVSLLLALTAIVVAIGLTAVVGHVFELSFFVVNMVSMIGLAVGIDYALFIIERYREERRRGVGKHEAITIAGGTASNAVLFSGVTVVLALLGLFIVPITTFRSLGIGAVLVVTVAVAAMLTLVPALLSLLGDRVNWPRIPSRFLVLREIRLGGWVRDRVTRRREAGGFPAASAAVTAGEATDVGATHGEASGSEVADLPVRSADHHRWAFSGFWGGIARTVMRRPVVSVVIAATLLVGIAIPYVDLRSGSAGAETLPPGDTKTAYTLLESEFVGGLSEPVEIVVAGERTPAADQAIDSLISSLESDPVFVPGAQVQWNGAGDLALVSVQLAPEPNAPESYEAIDRLRQDVIPAAFTDVPVEVLVSGETATEADSIDIISFYTPIVFAFVLGLSFFLLMVVFRSIVVPLKAIVMNLLSVGAAYGALVLVFQKGLGHALFGFQKTATIEAWVPIFLFCILFGLSMDYHVFLLSRIREHFDKTRRNHESVAVGLRSTGKIITGAAAIMVVVFSTFASGDLVMLQQVGFGLAIAVLLDATVVRSVLVPASMALLGDLNWYLPRWLHWLPRVSVEHEASHVDAATVHDGKSSDRS